MICVVPHSISIYCYGEFRFTNDNNRLTTFEKMMICVVPHSISIYCYGDFDSLMITID